MTRLFTSWTVSIHRKSIFDWRLVENETRKFHTGEKQMKRKRSPFNDTYTRTWSCAVDSSGPTEREAPDLQFFFLSRSSVFFPFPRSYCLVRSIVISRLFFHLNYLRVSRWQQPLAWLLPRIKKKYIYNIIIKESKKNKKIKDNERAVFFPPFSFVRSCFFSSHSCV